jgi:hypothetical protein
MVATDHKSMYETGKIMLNVFFLFDKWNRKDYIEIRSKVVMDVGRGSKKSGQNCNIAYTSENFAKEPKNIIMW